MFFTSAFVLGLISYASGQQTQTTSEKVEQVQQEVASNNAQIDTATVTSGVGIAGAGVILAKQLLDQHTNKKRDRTTDISAGRFIILQAKFYQAKKLYPHMTDSELLDLPVSNNPFATQTFGQAFTTEAELWADGNTTYWGAVKPNMSVPSATTVNAIKPTREDIKSVIPPVIDEMNDNQKAVVTKVEPQKPTPPPVPPANNTTVGK